MKNERNSKFNIVVILLILLKKCEREREIERISLDKEWEKLSKLNIVIILLNEFAIYLKKNLWTDSSLLNQRTIKDKKSLFTCSVVYYLQMCKLKIFNNVQQRNNTKKFRAKKIFIHLGFFEEITKNLFIKKHLLLLEYIIYYYWNNLIFISFANTLAYYSFLVLPFKVLCPI